MVNIQLSWILIEEEDDIVDWIWVHCFGGGFEVYRILRYILFFLLSPFLSCRFDTFELVLDDRFKAPAVCPPSFSSLSLVVFSDSLFFSLPPPSQPSSPLPSPATLFSSRPPPVIQDHPRIMELIYDLSIYFCIKLTSPSESVYVTFG